VRFRAARDLQAHNSKETTSVWYGPLLGRNGHPTSRSKAESFPRALAKACRVQSGVTRPIGYASVLHRDCCHRTKPDPPDRQRSLPPMQYRVRAMSSQAVSEALIRPLSAGCPSFACKFAGNTDPLRGDIAFNSDPS
jgi:hypothetical protein